MDRQPLLKGEMVELRPLRVGDWDALYAVASDPAIWAMHPMSDRWQESMFRAFFDDALAKGGALAVIDRGSGKIVGSSRFQDYRPEAGGSVEVGWTFLSRDCWGKGHNREMKRLMLAHALESVERVEFRVGAENWRSRKALEKIGAQLSDRMDVRQYGDGELVHRVYEMDREQFAAGPLAN